MSNNSQSHEGVRKPVLVVIAALALVAVALVVVRNSRSTKTEVASEQSSPPAAVPHVGRTPATPKHSQLEVNPTPEETPPPAPPPGIARPVTPPAPAYTGPAPTPETRGLVSTLANLDLKSGPLTPEAAAAWKQNLAALVQKGAASIPAIAEYLALNKDVAFDSVPGAAAALGSSSLRLSLLESLTTIGGPEAEALSAQMLGTATDPREIALVANALIAHNPEHYRESALAAARQGLAAAGGGQAAGRDVGPLFELFMKYGGASSAQDLMQTAGGQWKYYSTIALANLPNGAGVPSLIQMVTDPNSPGAGGRMAAMQMLAQSAPDHPDARNVLLDQARAGRIPSALWINIADVLGGNRFWIGTIPTEMTPNVRTWHLTYGNQNYYSAPDLARLTPDQVQQRLGLIEQLLPVAANDPLAVDSLTKARSTLQAAR